MQHNQINAVQPVISHRIQNAWAGTILAVTVAVLIATHLNQNIGYSNGAGCDSWYFFGIYRNYHLMRAIFGDAYQLDRFPAILPWIFLGPRISAAALTEARFWAYFLISVGCFSYSAIKLFGARIGPLVSILFLCSCLFLAGLSTDFVTAPGLTWECALIATLLCAATSPRPSRWLFFAGVLGAFCVFSHLPMAMFIFSTPLYLLLDSKKAEVRSLLHSVILMIAGFAAATLAFCLTSLLLGGNFVFFEHELLTAFSYVKNKPYSPPMSVPQWLSYDASAPLFFLAGAASMTTIIRLRLRRSATKFPHLVLPALIYLPIVALCFGFELSGRMVLQENVFAPWLLPTAFLAIGSTLALAELPSKALSVLVCAAAICASVWIASHLNPGLDFRWRYVFAGLALLTLMISMRFWSPMLAAGCIIALFAIDYPTGYGDQQWIRTAAWSGRLSYELVDRANKFIARYSGREYPSFWVSGDVKGLDDPLFVAIEGPRSFLRCANFAGSYPSLHVRHADWDQYFPDLPTAFREGYILAGHRLFIIARGRHLVNSATGAFHSIGLTAAPLDETELAPGISIAVAEIK